MTAKHSAATTGTPMTDAIWNSMGRKTHLLFDHARKLERALALANSALQEVSAWTMHSGSNAYAKGERDPCGYYNAAFYLMEAEIGKAKALAGTALRAIAQLENEGKESERG